MKVTHSVKKRTANCQIVRRKGRVFLIDKSGIKKRETMHQQANMNQGRGASDALQANLPNVGRNHPNSDE